MCWYTLNIYVFVIVCLCAWVFGAWAGVHVWSDWWRLQLRQHSPWLQLQAALDFSLTYDNAPVTLIRKPCSTFAADDCSRFFFFTSPFFCFFARFPPCFIHLLLPLLSFSLSSTLMLTHTHKVSSAFGEPCWLLAKIDHSRWRLAPSPSLLNRAAARVFNRICAH